jgi:hypothetical protein
MKNQNPVFIAIVFALAFALAPVIQAGPAPGGGPLPASGAANHQPAPLPLPPPPTGPEDVELPAISIHSAGNILRGKTGSFVLEIKPAVMFGATYVNFKVSGTAVAGVDYVLLVSPAYIGQTGYGTILVQTLPNPRGSSFRQSYSVVVTLETGAGYAVGAPSSATMWIKP